MPLEAAPDATADSRSYGDFPTPTSVTYEDAPVGVDLDVVDEKCREAGRVNSLDTYAYLYPQRQFFEGLSFAQQKEEDRICRQGDHSLAYDTDQLACVRGGMGDFEERLRHVFLWIVSQRH